jgi:hypothetical protein
MVAPPRGRRNGRQASVRPGDRRCAANAPGVNHDDTHTDVDPIEHPDVTRHLSEELRALLRRVDEGDEGARTEALKPAAAIVDALAAVGLLEYAYLAPGADDAEDGPIAWLEVGEAIADAERDSVVLAGSEVLEVFDGPITLEDPPEHEHDGEAE